MSTQLKWIKNSQFQSFLLLGLLAFFLAHFILLSPSGLEEDFNGVRVIHPKDLLNFLKNDPTLIPEVPMTITPSYSLRDMIFFSSTATTPNWKLQARKASAYQEAQIIHGRDLILTLPNQTIVQANEGVFFIDTNFAKVYGNVVATFPNGAIVESEYAEVKSKPQTEIFIPTSYLVKGRKTQGATPVFFNSHGLSYRDSEPQTLNLLAQVDVLIANENKTRVYSDLAEYKVNQNHLDFTMNENRPISEQFVKTRSHDLDILSRSLAVHLNSNKALEVIIARQDVYFEDRHDAGKLSTGTCGEALYYETKNEIHLKNFPQLYQDGDTITGNTIIFNRTTDIIEVKESNAIYKH